MPNLESTSAAVESDAFPSVAAGRGRRPRTRRSAEALALTRRRALQGIAAAGAVALTVVDALPGMSSRPAAAYTEWTSCRGLYSSSTTCFPSGYYMGADTCDASSWHKDTGWDDTGCIQFRYTLKAATCDGRNAWRWYHTGAIYTKCSDGIKETIDDCNNGDYVLSPSICKTSHG